MECLINIKWDNEANVWYAINDYIPLALESDSLDVLRKRVKAVIPELVELNHLEMPRYIYFLIESREELVA